MKPETPPPVITETDESYDRINDSYYARGWTDGLPIVPPTEEDPVAQTAPATRSKRGGARAGKAATADGPAPTLRILETRVLRGPNYWAREPVVRMLVDLGVLEVLEQLHVPFDCVAGTSMGALMSGAYLAGVSPEVMRWASPSTIAVLPTPGSPIRTWLFFVRRESTWMTRRISSSRPMTRSSFPRRASSVRSRPKRSSAWYWSSGFSLVTR